MTENDAIDKLNNLHYKIVHTSFCNKVYESEIEALCMAKDCLKEIQQYIAIGTIEELVKTQIREKVLNVELESYKEIGTIEEFKSLKEKNVAKKPIEKVLPYSEEFGFNSEWKCPTCGAYVGYFSEGMSEPEQMEYCNECGQHIAKDWTET